MNADLNGKIDQACSTAEDFIKLYYKHMDKSRHVISKLYMESGVLVWNGNGTAGNQPIQKFILDLPPSEHEINTLDSQPIIDDSVITQLTYLIQVSGNVKYQESQDKIEKPFQQTFMITAEADKWKIVSDCFRIQGGVKEGN